MIAAMPPHSRTAPRAASPSLGFSWARWGVKGPGAVLSLLHEQCLVLPASGTGEAPAAGGAACALPSLHRRHGGEVTAAPQHTWISSRAASPKCVWRTHIWAAGTCVSETLSSAPGACPSRSQESFALETCGADTSTLAATEQILFLSHSKPESAQHFE